MVNLRSDALNKTTAMLAHTYADISIEDLNVAGMVGNHGLARSIQDAAFAEFRRLLTYKTARAARGSTSSTAGIQAARHVRTAGR